LDPLIGTFANPAFPANLSLPTDFTYGLTVEGMFGDTATTGTYSPSGATADLMAQSGCPADDALTTALAAVPAPGPFSSTQCSSPLGPGMVGLGFDKCDPGTDNFKQDATFAFLCCFSKTLDSFNALTAVLLNTLLPPTIIGLLVPQVNDLAAQAAAGVTQTCGLLPPGTCDMADGLAAANAFVALQSAGGPSPMDTLSVLQPATLVQVMALMAGAVAGGPNFGMTPGALQLLASSMAAPPTLSPTAQAILAQIQAAAGR
jgi:hypothetical protein